MVMKGGNFELWNFELRWVRIVKRLTSNGVTMTGIVMLPRRLEPAGMKFTAFTLRQNFTFAEFQPILKKKLQIVQTQNKTWQRLEHTCHMVTRISTKLKVFIDIDNILSHKMAYIKWYQTLLFQKLENSDIDYDVTCQPMPGQQTKTDVSKTCVMKRPYRQHARPDMGPRAYKRLMANMLIQTYQAS